MLLFLSYADEDGDIAQEIAERLRSEHVSVCGETLIDPERAIQRADAFLALLSPDSLTSVSCRRERELALRRELHGAGEFVRVLQVRDTPYHQAGLLRSQPWFDLTGFGDLASRLASAGSVPSGDEPLSGAGEGQPPPPPPHFRNRDRELDQVSNGVTSLDGTRFWLLIASPQLGKTWLLRQIADRVQSKWRDRWMVRWVDVRDLPPEIAGDADAILMMMLGRWEPDGPGLGDVHDVAAGIIDNGRYHLCLLDSAELLDDRTIYRLRQHLSEIDEDIRGAADADCRVAVVAASRRDRGWTGLDPARLPQIRRLTEFSVLVVEEALENLAGRRVRPGAHQHAVQVHQLSEGLPALLAGCLEWISGNWRDLDRLGDWSTFHAIATPYVRDVLLSPASLRGSGGPMPTPEQQDAIRQALRLLCPFRLFTGSHLSDLAGRGDLRDALDRLGWTAHDLWTAVSGADLLYPSQKGAWLTIDPPIRRLLFRYWYPASAERGRANRDAVEFLRPFALEQSGTDAADMLVECLWHEAQAVILLEGPAQLERDLTDLARDLSAHLQPNRSFDAAALRLHAAQSMRLKDPELWAALSVVPGLLERLAEAVRENPQEHP